MSACFINKLRRFVEAMERQVEQIPTGRQDIATPILVTDILIRMRRELSEGIDKFASWLDDSLMEEFAGKPKALDDAIFGVNKRILGLCDEETAVGAITMGIENLGTSHTKFGDSETMDES